MQNVIESGRQGDIFEAELHFDYYRPEVPEKSARFDPAQTFLVGYGCHMLDQVISYFGIPWLVRESKISHGGRLLVIFSYQKASYHDTFRSLTCG